MSALPRPATQLGHQLLYGSWVAEWASSSSADGSYGLLRVFTTGRSAKSCSANGEFESSSRELSLRESLAAPANSFSIGVNTGAVG